MGPQGWVLGPTCSLHPSGWSSSGALARDSEVESWRNQRGKREILHCCGLLKTSALSHHLAWPQDRSLPVPGQQLPMAAGVAEGKPWVCWLWDCITTCFMEAPGPLFEVRWRLSAQTPLPKVVLPTMLCTSPSSHPHREGLARGA